MAGRSTWACQAEFTGRRVAVATSAVSEDLYVLDLNMDTAIWVGSLAPEVPRTPPCYDREVGHVIDADGAEAIFVSSGRHHGQYFLIEMKDK